MIKFVNKADVTDIYVFGDISREEEKWSDMSANLFVQLLRDSSKAVVHINSGGGDVFEAIAITNALRDFEGEVVISVEGLCASAATLLCCSGRKVTAAQNSLFMIHSPSVMLAGEFTEHELATMQSSLAKVTEMIEKMYRDRLKQEIDLTDELWLDASEAKELGLIDEIDGEVKLEVDAQKKKIYVNKLVFDMAVPERIGAAERARQKELQALGSDKLTCAIVKVGMKHGRQASEMKEYIEAVRGVGEEALTRKRLTDCKNEIISVIKEQLASGAMGVRDGAVPDVKMEQINKIIKFANGVV